MLSLTLFVASLLAASEPNSVTVSIQKLESNEGQVLCALFASKDGFPAELKRAKSVQRATIKQKKASCRFESVVLGRYAVAVIHDEDKDGELDTNFLGIPSEPVGVSNNVRGSFGPPKFRDASFQVADQSLFLKISVE
ncbi:MAG: DUF2141 domain-containing protein [Myxococcota bacterium]